MINPLELTIFLVVIGSIIFVILKYIFKSKKEITIEVKDCSYCPFKYKKKDMLYYSCKLNDTLEENEKVNYKTLEDMKHHCKIEGEMNIVITNKK